MRLAVAVVLAIALGCSERSSQDEGAVKEVVNSGPSDPVLRQSELAEPQRKESIGPLCPPPDDAEPTSSGAVTKIVREGDGSVKPPSGEGIIVVFDTSEYDCDGYLIGSGKSRIWSLDATPPIWRDVVKLMTKGEVRRAWFPDGRGKYRITDFELKQFGVLER